MLTEVLRLLELLGCWRLGDCRFAQALKRQIFQLRAGCQGSIERYLGRGTARFAYESLPPMTLLVWYHTASDMATS